GSPPLRARHHRRRRLRAAHAWTRPRGVPLGLARLLTGILAGTWGRPPEPSTPRLASLASPLLILLWISSSAGAAPLALSVSTSGGILESRTLGAARDDFQLTLRGALA